MSTGEPSRSLESLRRKEPSFMCRFPIPATMAGIVFCTSACVQVEQNGPIAESVDDLMGTLHELGHFNGAVVVGRDDEIIYERGFGMANVDEAVAFTPDTPTNIASVAKTLTSAAVITLATEGAIDLDDPVAQHLTGFPYPDVSIRHLLSHSSGLVTSYPADIELYGARSDNEAILSHLAAGEPQLSFAPGSEFQYSNAAFNLAALLVERVSGESFATFLGSRIFQPLEMRSTFVIPAFLEDWEEARTRSYRSGDDGLVPFDEGDNRGDYGSHGIYASARDVYRWASSFYSNPVLDDVALADGVDAPMLDDDYRSPVNLLGWYYADDRARHYFTGYEAGFYAFAYWDADRRHSIAVVSNFRTIGWVPQLLAGALIDIVEGRSPRSVEPPVDLSDVVSLPPRNAPPDELRSLAGRYRLSSGDEVAFSVRENVNERRHGSPLSVRVNDGPAFNAFPSNPDIYVVPLDASIVLTEEAGERTVHVVRVFEGVSTGTPVDQ